MGLANNAKLAQVIGLLATTWY